MKTFENQKTVVNNITITGRFYQVDEATFTLGCKALKPTTFLVWQAINLQYFTDKELGLSTSQICKLMGNIRKPTVQAAINELIEKGWMVCLGGNHYEVVSPCNEKRDTPDRGCNEKRDTPDRGCNEKRDRGCNEKRDTPVTKSVTERIIINNNKYNNNSLCNEKRDTPDEEQFLENRLDIVDSIDSESETSTASSCNDAASEDASAEEIEAVESIEETVPQNEECANCSQGVCTNHSQGVCTNHSQGYEQNAHRGMSETLTQSIIKEEEEVDSTASEEDDEVVCTSSTQGYVQEVHRGMYEEYTQSIIKEEEEVDSIYALDAAKEIEEELEVVEVQPAATTIEDAASEDAAASSGYDYIKQWESDANKYKDLLRPIQESGALKKFVKGTITPWHYDKSKTEQDYYDKLTALSLWNRVTHNSDFNMENDNNSKHPCFSLKRTYELWNQAEIFTPKD